ncbi:MAG: hypothetical protein IH931_06240, partial [candidate division Zixibacteria bacterium]|nr:hypothetical protein [candidate division Zixibacteria bacterium]
MNRKQKIVVSVTILILLLSFLFPPWADYFPVGSSSELMPLVLTEISEEEKMVVFVGYSSLFNSPDYYLHEHNDKIEYTEEAEKAIESRESLTQQENPFLRSIYSGQDSVARLHHLDSVIEAGKVIRKVNNKPRGFIGLYLELLIIQLSLIIVIS